jgi:hypothetical protein
LPPLCASRKTTAEPSTRERQLMVRPRAHRPRARGCTLKCGRAGTRCVAPRLPGCSHLAAWSSDAFRAHRMPRAPHGRPRPAPGSARAPAALARLARVRGSAGRARSSCGRRHRHHSSCDGRGRRWRAGRESHGQC